MSSGQRTARGRLKIYLSYAAGAGKTYRMLEEAQDMKKQGADIVIGYFEPHGRKDTIAKTEGLEIIPRKTMEYRATTLKRWIRPLCSRWMQTGGDMPRADLMVQPSTA